MNKRPSSRVPFLILSALAMPLYAAPDDVHSEMLTTLKSEIAARPSRVLVAVEDALTMEEQGACEIVKTAITLTKADAKLVGEIVYTALKHSPGMSAVIVECAVDTVPTATGEIKKAMQKALGESSAEEEDLTDGSGKAMAEDEASGKEEASGKGVSGKEPRSGKAPAPDAVEVEEDWLDFGRFISGIGSIYLSHPSSGVSPGGFIPGVTPDEEPQPTPEPEPTPPTPAR